jgi:HD domain
MKSTASTIGTLEWLRQSQGRLSVRERMHLLRSALWPAMQGMVSARWARALPGAPQDLRPMQTRMPDTPAVAQALEAMADLGHTALLQHGFRCHWWAMAFAANRQHEVDEELLLVASLMHDLGAADPVKAQASGCACFTWHSAEAAMQVARHHHWHEVRTQALGNAITLHMNGQVDTTQGLEAHLLQQATACDVIGARLAQLPVRYRQQVLQAHPREGFDAQFSHFMAGQARQQPGSRAALMHQVGLGLMIKLNPF